MTVVRASRYWIEATDAASAETLAAAPVPTRDGHPFSIARGGWAAAVVTDNPARQALAMLLLDWLLAPDHSAQWTQAAGYYAACWRLPSSRPTRKWRRLLGRPCRRRWRMC